MTQFMVTAILIALTGQAQAQTAEIQDALEKQCIFPIEARYQKYVQGRQDAFIEGTLCLNYPTPKGLIRCSPDEKFPATFVPEGSTCVEYTPIATFIPIEEMAARGCARPVSPNEFGRDDVYTLNHQSESCDGLRIAKFKGCSFQSFFVPQETECVVFMRK